MKLSIRQNYISEDLMEQSGYKEYLKLFDFLPAGFSEILDPLSKSEGTGHFKNLKYLKDRIEESKADIFDLISFSGKIPNTDNLFLYYENGSLNQYHLFELYHFIESQRAIAKIESSFPVENEFLVFTEEVIKILDRYTKSCGKKIRYNEKEEKLRAQIKQEEVRYKDELVALEKKVQKETGLKMIYPYPLEVDEVNNGIKNSELLNVTREKNLFKITIVPTEKLLKTAEEKKCLLESLKIEIDKKIREINRELAPFFIKLKKYNRKREFRTFQYVLLCGARKHNLVLPEFTEDISIEVEKGRLHQLELLKEDKFVPLDIKLKKGVNLLSGANMSGKTTVLKTVFFLASLVKLGLPVPAERVRLSYPVEIDINLKSSGDISKSQSGFSKELDFLTKKRAQGAFLFCDELFMTTDPENGAALSTIFIEDRKEKDELLFISSHYTEVSKVKGIELFKMKDADISDEKQDLKELLENTPYEVERIEEKNSYKDRKKPLLIALHFPVSEGVRDRIENELKKEL